MKNYLIVLLFFLTIICCKKAVIEKEPTIVSPPNIVLIMVDDMGFSDLGCYGGEIETPNIDRMATNGIRFSQFYNGSRCCPTRASLLTGLYPHQAGVGHMADKDYGFPGYAGDLSVNAVTIAEALKSSGYITAMSGKWHITKNTKENQSDLNHPTNRGFDRFYGTIPGHGSLWDPFGLKDGNKFIKAEGDYYYTEAITDHAVQYIKEADEKQKPLFLYVAYTAPHYPLHARQEVIDKYKGRFSEGWDTIRKNRYERLVSMGIIDATSQLSPRDEQSIPWEDEPEKEWQQNRMETFAAMVDHVDQGVGDILSELERSGQLDNTLVMFFSDNGGSAEGHRDGLIERWNKPWTSSMIPEYTRSGKKVTAGDFPDLKLGPNDTYGSYGVRWANVSNAPFRLHKSWLHEGGIASPLVVYWPAMIKKTNVIRHELVHIIDIMPTCLEISNTAYPESYKGNTIIPFEGKNIFDIINKPLKEERTLFWEHEGNRAIRKGKWKLVSQYPGTWSTVRAYEEKGAWELYNMEIDRTEMNNLSSQNPKLVEILSKEWQEWADRSMVIPWEKVTSEDY